MGMGDRPDIYDPWLIKHTPSAKMQKLWAVVGPAPKYEVQNICVSRKSAKKWLALNAEIHPNWSIMEYHSHVNRIAL